jgi:hypothetical protein
MSHTYPRDPNVATTETDTEHAKYEQIRHELERRFRHCLRSGQISPLLHLMIRYKSGVLS